MTHPASAQLTALLGVQWPLIQAPMAGVQGVELCKAVHACGALGSLPCATLTPEGVQEAVQALQRMGVDVFNLNFFTHQTPVWTPELEAHWRDVLEPHFEAYGLSADNTPPGAGRQPFSQPMMDLIEVHRPPVVSFHFGLPQASWVRQLKRWGCTVLSSATTVAEAQWLQAHGADAIIAQGLEAGGHRGHFLNDGLELQTNLNTLLPAIVAAVQVPVIAAGGLVDAAGIRAALALGAAGAQVGTAYLLSHQATTLALHRQALAQPGLKPTALTHLFTGRPARGLVNGLMQELGPMHPAAPPFPTATAAIAPLRAAAEAQGSTYFTPMWSGQNNADLRAECATNITKDLLQAFLTPELAP